MEYVTKQVKVEAIQVKELITLASNLVSKDGSKDSKGDGKNYWSLPEWVRDGLNGNYLTIIGDQVFLRGVHGVTFGDLNDWIVFANNEMFVKYNAVFNSEYLPVVSSTSVEQLLDQPETFFEQLGVKEPVVTEPVVTGPVTQEPEPVEVIPASVTQESVLETAHEGS